MTSRAAEADAGKKSKFLPGARTRAWRVVCCLVRPQVAMCRNCSLVHVDTPSPCAPPSGRGPCSDPFHGSPRSPQQGSGMLREPRLGHPETLNSKPSLLSQTQHRPSHHSRLSLHFSQLGTCGPENCPLPLPFVVQTNTEPARIGRPVSAIVSLRSM